ncbi:hypothetical protein HMPREF9714_02754 [Myroides odoratimimus CCUG 12901]|uniref:hypothetical protein n=1 Tax=Myroides TaxID=76831 RepID=UPI000246112D|nr:MULTISPECIES: hypothetical protein [Myroides]APA90793.1 hypothetical protein BK054_00690 [Myroides sp. ZB35]EHO06903.1 hypothetical protein HMPREF9714_02754 [Myroides odoratimimus CCUG 12901]MDM1097268.1 hypothetical protein [Myroides odoratimimus]MDX4974760.1 hypothetical protein [Myroides odoratimimus]
MKKTYIGFAGLSLLLLLGTQTVQAQQGFGTDKPNKSAAVDIQSSKRGLLIPRVELVETTNQEPITKPETSLMVYNQATANDVTPGYYYWDGTKWARFAKQSEITEITLDGDVTGPTNATVVGKIQGVEVSDTNPTANQVLTLVNGVWTPTTITSSLISDAKGITGTGITVGGTDNGAGSVLKEVTLSITHGAANQVMVTNADGNGTTWVDQKDIVKANETVTTIKEGTNITVTKAADSHEYTLDVPTATKDVAGVIKAGEGLNVDGTGNLTVNYETAKEKLATGNVTSNSIVVNDDKGSVGSTFKDVSLEIKAGTNGQVMVTKEGKATWVAQSEIVPTTTNALTKKNNNGTVDSNTIVSTVNGKEAEVKVIDNVTNTVDGTTIVTSVNGVESGSVDLKDAIQAGQKVTTVVNGLNTTVSSSVNPAGSNTTEYKVNVSNDDIQAAQKLTTVSEGNGVKVTPTTATGSTTTDYNVAINTDGGNAGDVLTVVKDGDTNTKVEWKKPEEYKNIYNSDGTLTSNRIVDFGKNTSLIFEKGGQSHGFTYDSDHTGLNMYGDKTSSIGLISKVESTNGIESKLKLNHDNDWSHINSSADKGFKLSTYYSKNISFETYKTYDGNSSALINLVIHGDGGVQVNNINKPEFTGESTNKVVVADADGVLKTVERAKVAPQFFYMPAVIFDTKSKGTGLERDLYKEYVDQFTGGKAGVGNADYPIAHGAGGYTMPYTGGIVGSDGAPADIAVFDKGELHYYVTYYDTKVFKNLKIDKDGKLTYDIIGNATPASYMNIVFVIK